MADEELDALATDGEEGEGEKKGGMMKIIIIAVAVVVLGVAGFFGWQMFMGGEEEDAKAKAAAQAGTAAGAAAAPTAGAPVQTGVLLELKPFIINLTGGGGKRLVKLTMTLDVGDEPTKAHVEKLMPRVRDALILMLSSKSYQDVADITGKVRLKKEILAIVNRNLGGTAKINAVFFTEFVIQ